MLGDNYTIAFGTPIRITVIPSMDVASDMSLDTKAYTYDARLIQKLLRCLTYTLLDITMAFKHVN